MSKITLKLTDKRWRDEFGLSKLDSWIAPKKRTRWFFRTSQSDEDNSLDGSNSKIQRNDGTADNTKDVRQMSKTQQHDDQVSMKPRVITVHTTDDNLHLDHHLDDKTLNSSPAVAVSYTPKSRASRTPRQAQRSFSDKSFPESIKHSIASSNNDMEVSSNDSPCLYERTCYAITSTQTRCALLPCKGKHYCQIHSKEIHGTLLEESIYRIGDLQYKGKPGTTQCRALSKRGAQCALTSVVKWDLCRRHLRSTPQFIVSLVQKSTSTSAYSNFEQTGRKSEEKRRSRDNKEPTLESLSSNNSDYEGSDEVSSSANSLSSSTYDDSSSSDDTTKSFSETEKTRRSSSSSSCSSGSELVSKEIVLSHGASKQAYWQEPLEFDHSKDVTFTQNANEERCVYISSSGEECPYRTMDKEDAVYCQGHDVLTARLKYLLRTRSSDAPHKCHESDGNLSSEASDDDGERQHSPSRVHETRPYTHREFMRLWKKCEDFVGESTDDIENTKHVRSANKGLCPEDTNRQAKAQYGRLLPQAMKTMMKNILCLTHNDVFLDIGHGIGNTCLQAAFTTGCEARGIEVVFSRNSIAEVFRDNMYIQHRKTSASRMVGEVKLRHGRLEDDIHREFLTKGITRAYVNNFNGVFAERSVKNNGVWFLDDYCAALFALMTPGAIMVTLHPLNLGPTQEEANCIRRKHDLNESSNASFFEVEKVVLGKACDAVKWNQHSGNSRDIYVYKYTRLAQEAGPDSVFMCCNPCCELAKKDLPISATTNNEEGRCVINQCDCKFTAKTLRRQQKMNYQ